MYEVTMPKLSDSMESGKVIEWKVKEGDRVSEGDVLAEVESDKAVMELECFSSGVVHKIVRGDGAEAPVGEVIALIAEAGEEAAQAPEPPAAEPRTPAAEAPVAAPPPAQGERAAPEPVAEAPPAPVEAEPTAREAPTRTPGERVAISPYARKLAEQKGLDYTRVIGSGPGGRIVAADIEQAAGTDVRAPVGPTAAAPAAPGRPSADEELPELKPAPDEADVEEAPFRLRTQAKRVIASQHVIPHFYITRGVDATELLALKGELKGRYGATVTHMIMFACVRALRAHPEVNSSYDRGRIYRWKGIHIGLAVDTDQGLTVAVVRDAQNLGLGELAERTNALVAKARAGRLSADERRYPTFTITNLGMLDVEHFEPIINPPSSITLAEASALPQAVVRNGALHVGLAMKLTAACDHRIIDGAMAARFLQDVRAALEAPEELMGGDP